MFFLSNFDHDNSMSHFHLTSSATPKIAVFVTIVHLHDLVDILFLGNWLWLKKLTVFFKQNALHNNQEKVNQQKVNQEYAYVVF